MKTVVLKKYFWDTDFRALNIKNQKKYILERVLELGDEKAAKWMLKNFSKKDILAALKNKRNISERSRIFWKLFLARRK